MKKKTAGIIMAIGGAIMAIGPFLTFASVETPVGSQSFTGLAPEVGDDGKLYLGVGIGLLIFGIVVLAVGSVVVRRILGAIGVLASGFMTFAGIRDITGIEDNIPAELLGQVSISPGIGLYLALGGAVVALIGSVMAIAARDERIVVEPPPPPPPAEGTPPRPPEETPPPPA